MDGYSNIYIAYTEQRPNHGTMILDGVCYSGIHFGRVILNVWGSPPVVSLFWSYLASTLFLLPKLIQLLKLICGTHVLYVVFIVLIVVSIELIVLILDTSEYTWRRMT